MIIETEKNSNVQIDIMHFATCIKTLLFLDQFSCISSRFDEQIVWLSSNNNFTTLEIPAVILPLTTTQHVKLQTLLQNVMYLKKKSPSLTAFLLF